MTGSPNFRTNSKVPSVGAEQPLHSAGKSMVDGQGDALSDACSHLSQVDDARLAVLIECWPKLSERVKVEISQMVENDQTTEIIA